MNKLNTRTLLILYGRQEVLNECGFKVRLHVPAREVMSIQNGREDLIETLG